MTKPVDPLAWLNFTTMKNSITTLLLLTFLVMLAEYALDIGVPGWVLTAIGLLGLCYGLFALVLRLK